MGAPLSLGPGAYVASLEAATHRPKMDTIICGKPSGGFLSTCIDLMRDKNSTEDKEERNIIIGDDIDADLGGGAIELGLERVLGTFRQKFQNAT